MTFDSNRFLAHYKQIADHLLFRSGPFARREGITGTARGFELDYTCVLFIIRQIILYKYKGLKLLAFDAFLRVRRVEQGMAFTLRDLGVNQIYSPTGYLVL